MKKFIAISVMFAMVVAGAFAADVSGQVFGTFDVAGQVGDADMTGAGAGINIVRVEVSGANEDETFGAWIRADGYDAFATQGYAWWQPIPQLKVKIGEFSDGFWGKDGFSCWMYYQTASDTGVVSVGNAWYSDYLSIKPPSPEELIKLAAEAADDPESKFDINDPSTWYIAPITNFREAFYGGFGGPGLFLEITPMEMLGINIGIPYSGIKLADAYQALHLQFDLNLDFGNIAITYTGSATEDDKGKIFLYFGLSAIENLSLDIGFGYDLNGAKSDYYGTNNGAFGVAGKFAFSDSFALKFRAMVDLWDDVDLPPILFDIMPIIGVNDSMTAFISVGAAVCNKDDMKAFDWHFNPYVQIGSEWGPSFYAGILVQSLYDLAADESTISWKIPVALGVSF